MSEELVYETFSKRMHERFPLMFSKPYGGFTIGEGWYDIIESLCANIQSHMDWKNRESQVVPQVIVEQIKEKFGGLRFYYQGGDDTISGMVRMAEAWASTSCETCGDKGTQRGGGWVRTLCDKHEEERQLIMNERKENV